MPIQKLLFVDTNIWLDFYRARNEINLELLKQLEKISDRIIVTYQLESEFKKNRQSVMQDAMRDLKSPTAPPRFGIFSDAKAAVRMASMQKHTDRAVKTLRTRMLKALAHPAANDPVYQACQRIFHKNDALVLTRENPARHTIRRRAFKRFLHGCPPRKSSDTSIGDAINWEWMVHCATERIAELVIVSRDSDYGVSIDNSSFVNDHLRQEFSDRVSRKRKLLLYTKVSEALKHFAVAVSKEVSQAEAESLSSMQRPEKPETGTLADLANVTPEAWRALRTARIDAALTEIERRFGPKK